MIDHIGRVNMDFMVRLAGDPAWARQELDAMETYNREQGALYEGEPVPVSLKPNFISPRQRDILDRASKHVHGALDTFVDLFLEDAELQAMWEVSDEELDLYQVDPGYPGAIQVSRFDGFLRDYDLKFLEFNCDSPGGAGYGDVIHEAFVRMLERNPEMDLGCEIDRRHRCTALAQALQACYQAWRSQAPSDRPEHPFVVVSDWEEVPSRPDIDVTVRRFQEQGIDAVFADPRSFTLDGDELFLEDRRVDLVYKRVIVKELLSEPAASDLLEAYRAGTVCLVNSPRSVIVGNKKIMAALRRPEVQAALTAEQRRAVAQHVPWTEILRDAKVDFQGYQVNLRDFAIDNRAELVLKPARGYGGKDVMLGFEADDATWGKLVDEHIKDGDWVIQQLVEIPKELFPKLGDQDVNMELVNVNVNPFVFGGRFAGAYTRISKKNVINVSYGGGLAPTVTAIPTEEPTP